MMLAQDGTSEIFLHNINTNTTYSKLSQLQNDCGYICYCLMPISSKNEGKDSLRHLKQDT